MKSLSILFLLLATVSLSHQKKTNSFAIGLVDSLFTEQLAVLKECFPKETTGEAFKDLNELRKDQDEPLTLKKVIKYVQTGSRGLINLYYLNSKCIEERSHEGDNWEKRTIFARFMHFTTNLASFAYTSLYLVANVIQNKNYLYSKLKLTFEFLKNSERYNSGLEFGRALRRALLPALIPSLY